VDMTNEQYLRYVADRAAPSPLVKDLAGAFFAGGGGLARCGRPPGVGSVRLRGQICESCSRFSAETPFTL